MWFDPDSGAVAKTHSEIRMLRPNASLQAELTDEIIRAQGFKAVLEVTKPEYDEVTNQLTEGVPTLVNGAWVQTWILTPYPSEVAADRFAAAKASYLAEVRDLREKLFNRLAGIGFSAYLANDQITVDAWQSSRTRLKNITTIPGVTGATDIASLKAAVKAEYAAIVASVPESLVNAFDEVDA